MERFNDAVSVLPRALRDSLLRVDAATKKTTFEVRLRAGKPPVLFGKFGSRILNADGTVGRTVTAAAATVPPALLCDCFARVCAFSVHSHQTEIARGFVTLKNGHRVGVCGTAVVGPDNLVRTVRDVASLNLRVAREHRGAAEPLRAFLSDGLLLAGPPASGKTTLLRDAIRILSDPDAGFFQKVAVADERMELCAAADGLPGTDVGCNCDVLSGYPKETAVEIAVRALSPEVLVCDELVTKRELEAVKLGVNTGVRFLASVHAADRDDLCARPVVEDLLSTGAFRRVALLRGKGDPGTVETVMDAKELRDEIYARRVGMVL